MLIQRDLSWLYFNERVLQEAKDPRVPLYERIKFLAIYSSNLDEFFRVRVASLRSFGKLRKKTRRKMEIKPKKVLREVMELVRQQQEEFGRIFRTEIIPGLTENGIHLIQENEFNESQQAFAKAYFEKEEIAKYAAPVFLKEGADTIPFLENKGLYFIVTFQEENTPPALVNIPSEQMKRFVVFPNEGANANGHYITFLDEIVRHNLPILFAGKTAKGAYSIKLSRDAEMYIEDEYDGNLLEKIKGGLGNRNVGLPTRFLFDSTMPDELLTYLKTLLAISKNDLVSGGRYHNFNDFFGFPDPSKNEALIEKDLPPLPHPVLENAESILKTIAEKDQMLHFPYQKFDYVPKMIYEAADDPKVVRIQLTLYRVASDSRIGHALLHALEKGKEVFAFIETKARFDEASNIEWGERLQKAGAKVRYSIPGIKVHTKLLLINRKEGKSIKHYGYYGTGNFNEKTAKLYCDHGLFSANPRLGEEANRIFMMLEGKIIYPHCKHLLVSPFTTRLTFEKLIDHEIAFAKEGKPAYIILKMNSLEDGELIAKLYEASQAGVKIQLIVRGICRCIPGIEGLSENIQIISILDRFLEHARVYIFGNNGKERMYTASADWMTRNLDKRVEVCMPIYDADIYRELRQIIDIQLNDNVKARWIDADQSNEYKMGMGEREVRAQVAIYDFLKIEILP